MYRLQEVLDSNNFLVCPICRSDGMSKESVCVLNDEVSFFYNCKLGHELTVTIDTFSGRFIISVDAKELSK